MERKNEIKEIDSIIEHAKEFKNTQQTIYFKYQKIIYVYKKLRNLNFFRFVPKTNQSNKKDFLEFSVELKGLERSYNLKNYLFGLSAFYFSVVLDNKPKYFGVKTIMKFLFISSYMLYKNLENQLDYFEIMREIYFDELIILKDKLEKDKNGGSEQVKENVIKYKAYEIIINLLKY